MLLYRFCIAFVAILTCSCRAHIAKPERAFITDAPDLAAARALKQRDSGTICAYVSGDPNSPLSCPGTSTCTYVGGGWGCCDPIACRTPAICEGFGTPYCGGVGSANCVYSQIEQCTNTASPACVKYIRETGPAADEKRTSWGCGPTSITITVLAETTGAAAAASSSTPLYSAAPTLSPSANSLESSTASITPTSSNSSSASSGLSTSDKIGLGVGIPAAVAAIIGIPIGIAQLLRTRKGKS